LEACLAVDIGGTKLACGVVTAEGKLLSESRVLTPKGPDPEALFCELAALVSEVSQSEPGLAVCGVGCGGPMSPRGEEVSPLNIPAWVRFPLRSRLEQLTGLPVYVDNDAKALALGEGWVGAARSHTNFMAMVVSTGVGGGIVLDGRLLEGRLGNAGHIGHVNVVPDGRPCQCGARGCLEAEASGSAIAAMTGRSARGAPPEVVARTGRLVGRAVASVSNLLDLDLTVVAGSVALGFGEPFFDAAAEELAAQARLEFSRHALLEPAGLGADGPLVGAAAVAWHALGRVILGGS
jgi:glucokinase